MKKLKRLSIVLISILALGLGIKTVSAAPGEITLSKTATKEDVTYGRDADVTLTIDAEAFTTIDKTDVVLVLDRSTSMNGTKMDDTKKAAIKLIDALLTEKTKENVRVGVTTYGRYVYTEYSSTSLSNDATTLKNIINSIPNPTELTGTNIQSGLIHANELLANSGKDRNKIVILLSDGIPNRYFGSDNTTLCKNSSTAAACNSTSSSASKNIAKDMKKTTNKNGAITIYTIGFDVETTSDAYILLGDIATSSNHRFHATDYTDLEVTFNAIVNDFALVANSGVVTDIVPEGFRIVKISASRGTVTTKENEDKTTTITWTVGDIKSTDTPTLTYKLEANKGHYGSMYTNKSAILTAKKVDENPAYVNKDITLVYEKPVVPIPSVTNDDDYGNIKQGTILEVDLTNDILTNDELVTKHVDENANVENKIVIFTDEETTGNLKDIVLDETTGTFIYTSTKDILGEITYKYYVESYVTIDGETTKVISNTSEIKINVIKNPTEYKVNYLELNTNKVLHNPKNGIGNLYEDVTEKAIDIEGYNKTLDTEVTITLDEDTKKNVINFYYVQNLGTVRASYVDTEGNTLADPVITTGRVSTEYKTNAKEIENYELIEIKGNETGKYTEETIEVIYIYEFVMGEGDVMPPNTGITENNSNLYYTIAVIYLLGSLVVLKRKCK